MKTKIFEHTSFADLDAEGRGRNRMLPIILAFEKMKGKENKLTISLKNSRDYYILWQQFVAAGNKISLKDPRNGQEIGPQKFAKSLELLGLEDPIDLQDFIEDATYRNEIEAVGIKFSFSKDVRNKIINPGNQSGRANGKLAEVGITDEEGVTWEWGTTFDEDSMKQAPEGRDIWVIRTPFYEDGYPCMFLYPLEGSQISKYSTALDIFFMNKSKETGVIYEYYDPKKFNLLWVACPCTFGWFLDHPVPDEAAARSSELEEQRKIEDTDITTYSDDDIEEELVVDREALKRLVESYGKQDVVNFVNHLNESSKSSDIFSKYSDTVLILDVSESLLGEYKKYNSLIWKKLLYFFKRILVDKCEVFCLGNDLQFMGAVTDLINSYVNHSINDIDLSDIVNSYKGSHNSNFSALNSIKGKYNNVILITTANVYQEFKTATYLGTRCTNILIFDDDNNILTIG